MSCVYFAVIVDVGSIPQQQVDQLIVAHTQRNLKDKTVPLTHQPTLASLVGQLFDEQQYINPQYCASNPVVALCARYDHYNGTKPGNLTVNTRLTKVSVCKKPIKAVLFVCILNYLDMIQCCENES